MPRTKKPKAEGGKPRNLRVSTTQHTRAWEKAFFESLRKSANVTWSAAQAGVTRDAAYKAKATDAEFAAKFDAACEEAYDILEGEAWRRAVEGCEEPVYQGGVQVGAVQRYSDTLMCLLLKGNRKEKYRERQEMRHVTEERLGGLDDEKQRDVVVNRLRTMLTTSAN